MKTINETQYKILDLLSGFAGERYFNYSGIASNFPMDIKLVKKEMTELKKLGVIDFARGLMDENGQVAGSGFSVKGDYYKYMENYLEQLSKEKEDYDN